MVIKGEEGKKRRDVDLGRLCYVMLCVSLVLLALLVLLGYVMLCCVVVCYSNVGRRG